MALKLKITSEDIAKSQSIDAGWHYGTITAFETKDSKDSKSKNFVWTLEVIKSEPDVENVKSNKGRSTWFQANSKALGMAIPFLQAALRIEITDEFEFEPEKLVGKDLLFEATPEEYKGVVRNKPSAFAVADPVPF